MPAAGTRFNVSLSSLIALHQQQEGSELALDSQNIKMSKSVSFW